LQPGDVVERVNGRRATSASALAAELHYGSNVPGDLIGLLVKGKTNTRWVTVFVGRVNVASLMADPAQLQATTPAAISAGAENPNPH
jgi:hypothetical protein